MLNYFLILLMVCVAISEAFGSTEQSWTEAKYNPQTKIGFQSDLVTMVTYDATCKLKTVSGEDISDNINLWSIPVKTNTWCTDDTTRYYSFEPSAHHVMISGAVIAGAELVIHDKHTGHVFLFEGQ